MELCDVATIGTHPGTVEPWHRWNPTLEPWNPGTVGTKPWNLGTLEPLEPIFASAPRAEPAEIHVADAANVVDRQLVDDARESLVEHLHFISLERHVNRGAMCL